MQATLGIEMTDAILGIGLVCVSASLWVFARALRHNPLPGATGQIITSDQWAHLRNRAAAERDAAPPPPAVNPFKRPKAH